jgi:hypothetical protein
LLQVLCQFLEIRLFIQRWAEPLTDAVCEPFRVLAQAILNQRYGIEVLCERLR